MYVLKSDIDINLKFNKNFLDTSSIYITRGVF